MPSASTTTSPTCGSCRRRRCCRNGGTKRGLPISCFLNEANDSLEGIVGLWNENVWLAARGGGIGSYWGNLRSIGEKVGMNGKTSGVVPFIRVMDSLTLAISQGSLRRGSAAVYLPVSHPEIEEFIEIRRPTGGDPNRKALNLHHGLLISDAFMRAVENDEEWALTSPKDGAVLRKISARSLWIRILTARIETGEPYLIFVDHVNKARPEHHKLAGLEVKTSNLCSEITLPTGVDHHGKQRTAVCCLSSLNLETYLEWHEHPTFIEDVMRFLDNVLQGFIDEAGTDFARATYAAMRERSVGLGVMGFHSFLQQNNIPARSRDGQGVEQEDVQAHPRPVRRRRRRPWPRNAAPARMPPTSASRSASPTSSRSRRPRRSRSSAAAPRPASSRRRPTSTITRRCRAPSWCATRTSRSCWTRRARTTRTPGPRSPPTQGSVQHLDCLDDHEKAVFKTAFEIDQRWLIEHAADRTPYICQSQSLNIFLPADVHKRDLHQIHMMAWKRGVKTLYYCRSLSIQRADVVSNDAVATPIGDQALTVPKPTTPPRPCRLPRKARRASGYETNNYEECLSCQ